MRSAAAPRRRAARTVIDEIFRRLVTWLAPILCFTTEEAWLLRFPDDSVHLHASRRRPPMALAGADREMELIRELRRVVTGALEIERRER